ncbi:hypothetical protein ABN034_13565 [Actinopolymorpha sp. B11F2]|uniref:hypothetical protein n=1 Tax=Actinopolymorpha sp. B11F2 TaxID=3160862 RepID=UPI0032E52E3E
MARSGDHRIRHLARWVATPTLLLAAAAVLYAAYQRDVPILIGAAVVALVAGVIAVVVFDVELIRSRRAHGADRVAQARAYAAMYAAHVRVMAEGFALANPEVQAQRAREAVAAAERKVGPDDALFGTQGATDAPRSSAATVEQVGEAAPTDTPPATIAATANGQLVDVAAHAGRVVAEPAQQLALVALGLGKVAHEQVVATRSADEQPAPTGVRPSTPATDMDTDIRDTETRDTDTRDTDTRDTDTRDTVAQVAQSQDSVVQGAEGPVARAQDTQDGRAQDTQDGRAQDTQDGKDAPADVPIPAATAEPVDAVSADPDRAEMWDNREAPTVVDLKAWEIRARVAAEEEREERERQVRAAAVGEEGDGVGGESDQHATARHPKRTRFRRAKAKARRKGA